MKPGDFKGCIWNRDLLSSFDVYLYSRELFISKVITLSTKSSILPIFIGFAEVESSWKYCSTTCAIWSSNVNIWLWLSEIHFGYSKKKKRYALAALHWAVSLHHFILKQFSDSQLGLFFFSHQMIQNFKIQMIRPSLSF